MRHRSRQRRSRYTRRRIAVSTAVGAAFLLLVTACSSSGGSAAKSAAPPSGGAGSSATGGWASVVAAANREGQVVFDSSDSNDINAAVIKAFNKQYPKIKVKLIAAGPDIAARVASAEQSGIHNEDVISTGFQSLVENKSWFIGLNPTNLPVLGQENWPADMKSDTWVAKYNQYLGVAWNKSKIDGSNLKTWTDLLNSQYAGKIALPDPRATATNSSWLDAVDQVLGDSYVKKVYALKPNVEAAGSVAASQDVAAGSHALSFPQSSMLIADLATKGAPIDFRVLTGPLVEVPAQLAVFNHAPHPNAALVFANFRESPAGMSVVCKAAGPPGQSGFAAPYTNPVPGCYTAPAGQKAIQGSKTLTAKDPRYIHLLSLLHLKPTTS